MRLPSRERDRGVVPQDDAMPRSRDPMLHPDEPRVRLQRTRAVARRLRRTRPRLRRDVRFILSMRASLPPCRDADETPTDAGNVVGPRSRTAMSSGSRRHRRHLTGVSPIVSGWVFGTQGSTQRLSRSFNRLSKSGRPTPCGVATSNTLSPVSSSSATAATISAASCADERRGTPRVRQSRFPSSSSMITTASPSRPASRAVAISPRLASS